MRSAITTTLLSAPRANVAIRSMCANLVRATTPKSAVLRERDN
jgi:hypothetical protein